MKWLLLLVVAVVALIATIHGRNIYGLIKYEHIFNILFRFGAGINDSSCLNCHKQKRRKDFLIGGAQYVINYFLVQNIHGTD